MKAVRRAFTVGFSVLISLVFLSHAALADGITAYAASDYAEEQGTNPETLLEDCFDLSGASKTEGPINYRQFTDVGNTTRYIHLDEYDPPSPASPSHPAVVLVHGGGFVAGCRIELDALPAKIASYGYIVFNIDYRLACDIEDHPSVWLCGPYNFYLPPSDVGTAINYVNDNAGNYASFNGQVVAIGTSGGGNLVYLAGVTQTGDYKPDVMAGVSPFAELGYMTGEAPMCSGSSDVTLCRGNTEKYMGSVLAHQGHPYHCEDNWKDASPDCNISQTNVPPPTFIANATEEFSILLAEQDFDGDLDGVAEHELCTVDGDNSTLHGTRLLDPDVDCDSPLSGSVFDNMMDFIADNLP